MTIDRGALQHLTWQIAVAATVVADAASDVSVWGYNPELLEAVLADHYRAAGVAPLAAELFALATAGLDDAGWLRLAVITGMFACPQLRAVLPAVSQRMPVREQIEKAMVASAVALHAVDLGSLASSPVRAEELARRVAQGLGVSFEGETPAQSAARLTQIDYARLLAKVEDARASAEERMREQSAQCVVVHSYAPRSGMGVRPRISNRLARAGALVRTVLGVRSTVLPPYRGKPPGQLVEAARAWAEEQVAELLKRQEAEDSRVARWRRGAQ